MAGNQTISAFPEGDNMMKWAAKITGPIGTVSAFLRHVCLLFPISFSKSPLANCFLCPGLRQTRIQISIRIFRGISIQLAQSHLRHALLPSQCRSARQYLPRYSQGQ